MGFRPSLQPCIYFSQWAQDNPAKGYNSLVFSLAVQRPDGQPLLLSFWAPPQPEYLLQLQLQARPKSREAGQLHRCPHLPRPCPMGHRSPPTRSLLRRWLRGWAPLASACWFFEAFLWDVFSLVAELQHVGEPQFGCEGSSRPAHVCKLFLCGQSGSRNETSSGLSDKNLAKKKLTKKGLPLPPLNGLFTWLIFFTPSLTVLRIEKVVRHWELFWLE